ncbi:MAG: TlpA family protein disulfide reductase [Sphingomonadaceae bacterium]|nr:TlpA family protein disulfide reductase [Sphingomonadaceae bacterium]
MSRWSLTLVLALTLACGACDRQAGEAAQGEPGLAGDKASLGGTFDRSQAGALMPAVTVRDPKGAELNLGALQGQPALLNLWATWCAPCVVEMPMLDELAQELDGAVRVVTVSQDLAGADKVVPFFAQRSFRKLEPWLDPDNALGFKVESEVLPATILYDASGREVWRVVGEYDWSSAAAREAIAEASAE